MFLLVLLREFPANSAVQWSSKKSVVRSIHYISASSVRALKGRNSSKAHLQEIRCSLYSLHFRVVCASPERARQLKSPGWSRMAEAKQGRSAEPWVHVRQIPARRNHPRTAASPPPPRAPWPPARATPAYLPPSLELQEIRCSLYSLHFRAICASPERAKQLSPAPRNPLRALFTTLPRHLREP